MRVLSVLALLCVCVLGVTGQYTLDGSSNGAPGQGWFLTGGSFGTTVTGPNPVLNFAAGNTYNFTVSSGVDTNHPFAFSSLQNSGTATISAVDGNVTVTSNGCGGTATTGYINTGCVIYLNISSNAPNSTIWYKCTIHSVMTGQINIIAASAATNTTNTTGATTAVPTTPAPTTPAPTTPAPTTPAPTNNGTNATTAVPTTGAPTTPAPTTAAPTTPAPTTSGTIVSNTFHITNNDGINAYLFTQNGVVYSNPTLQVTAGSLVTFSFEWSRSYNHPFGFSNDSTTTAVAATSQYFPDAENAFVIKTTGTCDTNYGPSVNSTIKTVRAINDTTISPSNPCTVTVQTQKTDVGTIYYRCAKHPKMVGAINIVAAGNNGNSASTITISGLTLIVAIIAAIMA